ncbi:MAG: lytic transglycosylase domain-containing protein [Acetobacteraceae bacterium]|nr:lytic transglycosylase domain-containing protein [Acetobacteraceae bacterium]
MRRIRPPPVLVWLLVLAACAQGPMEAVRGNRWAEAQQDAGSQADPVAGKLVTYFRLLAPNGGSAAEIAEFIDDNPAWPGHAQLEQRREEALASEPDQSTALAQCDRREPELALARLRCADAYTAAGRPNDSARQVRRAWGAGIVDPAEEAAFLRRFGATVRPVEQSERFDALIAKHPDAAARQVARLDPQERSVAQARLALRRDEPNAAQKLAGLPGRARNEPPLLWDEAAWLRRRDRLEDARNIWVSHGQAIEQAAPANRWGAIWTERNALSRQLLRAGDAQGAYAVAAGHGPTAPEQIVDAGFLAGFIALRWLHDPAKASSHFRTLAGLSDAAITQARAHYWLARAEAAAGRSPRAEYEKSAAWPTTFYGQLAAIALDKQPAALAERIRALRDAAWTPDQALDFGGVELVRAASLLTAWGDPRRAHAFLLRADEQARAETERSLAAHLAGGLGMPDMAVAIARRMGRDGLMLPQAGWPAPVDPPENAPGRAVVLALIRQESGFDGEAVSPSGARGLMQLMPQTAQSVAAGLGIPLSVAALTEDTRLNMRLGTAYLQSMLGAFGNSLPLALAAYNAGPTRVQQWLAENGDPRGSGIDMIDWIELIPFGETRNYVQRVLENTVVYEAQLGETNPVLLADWSQ